MLERLMQRGVSSGRTDDNEETIKKRLVTHKEHTEPVLDYFGEQHRAIIINADQTVATMFDKVKQILDVRCFSIPLSFSLSLPPRAYSRVSLLLS